MGGRLIRRRKRTGGFIDYEAETFESGAGQLLRDAHIFTTDDKGENGGSGLTTGPIIESWIWSPGDHEHPGNLRVWFR
jgi:hypothetical protein